MRAAIFDLDGTLADTSADLIRAANASLAAAGFGRPLDARTDRAVALHGGRAMLRLALERELGAPAPADLVDALYPPLLDAYAAEIAAETRLYAGVETALGTLTDAGWRLGVCTNKPHGLAEALLERLGIRPRFASVIGADLLAFRKPDPRHLTETIARAGGAAGRAVLVGDTVTDRDAARAAGVPCVLVSFGEDRAGVDALGSAAVIGHFDELPALLDRLVPADHGA